MRIVVAMDSFKGTLGAAEACSAAARGVRQALPGAEVVECPLADGGEGTAEVLRKALGGSRHRARVRGPMPGSSVEAEWVLLADGTAVIDTAAASGLPLLRPGDYDPLSSTTFGTGELMLAAGKAGAARLRVAAGGSATVDGGTGALAALGWCFLDRNGRPLPAGGGALAELRHIEPPATAPALPPLDVLCDVRNPLCGPRGAARVFAPQKGADRAAVSRLEAGLERLAELLGEDSRTRRFGGAAGGLAIGLRRALGASLLPGAAAVADAAGLHGGAGGLLGGTDWVVTGEGRLDETSFAGKVVGEVVARARSAGARSAVLAGRSVLGAEALRRSGIERLGILQVPDAPDPAPAEAASRLAAAASRWAREESRAEAW